MSSKTGGRWRFDSTVREVVLGLVSNWRWHLVVVVISAAIVAFTAVTDGTAVVDAVTAERVRLDAGQYAFVVKSADPAAGAVLDADTCTRLNNYPTVVASGGLAYVGLGEVAGHPGTPFRVYRGVGRIRRVLDPSDRVGGSSGISGVLARQVGVPDGSTSAVVAFDGADAGLSPAPQPVSSRWFNPNGRNEFADVLWIVSGRPKLVDECWAEFTPASAPLGRAMLHSAFDGGSGVSVVDVLPPDDRVLSPSTIFDRRATNGLYVPIGILLAAPSCLVMWFNRGRSALYRSLGSGRLRAAMMSYVESSWVLTVSTVTGLAVARIVLVESTDTATIDSWSVTYGNMLIVLAAALAFTGLTAVATSSGNLMSQLKDRI